MDLVAARSGRINNEVEIERPPILVSRDTGPNAAVRAFRGAFRYFERPSPRRSRPSRRPRPRLSGRTDAVQPGSVTPT